MSIVYCIPTEAFITDNIDPSIVSSIKKGLESKQANYHIGLASKQQAAGYPEPNISYLEPKLYGEVWT